MRATPERTMVRRGWLVPSGVAPHDMTPSFAARGDAGVTAGWVLWPLLFPYRPPRNIPASEVLSHPDPPTRPQAHHGMDRAVAAESPADTAMGPATGRHDVGVPAKKNGHALRRCG